MESNTKTEKSKKKIKDRGTKPVRLPPIPRSQAKRSMDCQYMDMNDVLIERGNYEKR